jgi:hypothetical protein
VRTEKAALYTVIIAAHQAMPPRDAAVCRRRFGSPGSRAEPAAPMMQQKCNSGAV